MVIFSQLHECYSINKFFHERQYGLRPKHLKELSALELFDRILSDMDNEEIPLNVFMALSKAFGIIDYEILLHKLGYCGITNTSLTLMKRYLTNS